MLCQKSYQYYTVINYYDYIFLRLNLNHFIKIFATICLTLLSDENEGIFYQHFSIKAIFQKIMQQFGHVVTQNNSQTVLLKI